MAYFERADEANKLVVCMICDANCSERGFTVHVTKCIGKDTKSKKVKGLLEVCKHDKTHIVEKGNMSQHLEFCTKHQSQLKDEYQKLVKNATYAAYSISCGRSDQLGSSLPSTDDWNLAGCEQVDLSKDFKSIRLE